MALHGYTPPPSIYSILVISYLSFVLSVLFHSENTARLWIWNSSYQDGRAPACVFGHYRVSRRGINALSSSLFASRLSCQNCFDALALKFIEYQYIALRFIYESVYFGDSFFFCVPGMKTAI